MQIKTLLARQGIYTQEGEVYAYELLYRNGDALTANVDNSNASTADAATSSVITQLFANLEMDNVIGDKHAFINFTYNHGPGSNPNKITDSRTPYFSIFIGSPNCDRMV